MNSELRYENKLKDRLCRVLRIFDKHQCHKIIFRNNNEMKLVKKIKMARKKKNADNEKCSVSSDCW